MMMIGILKCLNLGYIINLFILVNFLIKIINGYQLLGCGNTVNYTMILK